MISGHMWNQIRNPPYSMPGRDGSPGFIAAGFQNQFGLETQIVAVICMYWILVVELFMCSFLNKLGLLTFNSVLDGAFGCVDAVLCGAVIALIGSITDIKNPAQQRSAVWIWLGIFGVMFSMLLYIFRLKNPGYPFRFLF